ncbi:MAG: phosphatase PAP2 family protein [Planctomycetota bacterium]|nr:MAG: phosphatase PAP2 family protein [Planctomycetota bacterium]
MQEANGAMKRMEENSECEALRDGPPPAMRHADGPPWHRLRWWTVAGAITFTVSTAAAFQIDGWCAEHLQPLRLPGDIRKAIHLTEAFAHGFGAGMILLVLWVAAQGPTRRRVAMAVLITCASGLAGNLSKALFVRVRPYAARNVIVDPGGGIHLSPPILAAPAADRVPPRWTDASIRSFPSGHAATAWGLAIGLSIVAPRAAALFVLLAILASMQRLVAHAHYLSDVTAGAALACWVSLILLRVPTMRRILERPPPTRQRARSPRN